MTFARRTGAAVVLLLLALGAAGAEEGGAPQPATILRLRGTVEIDPAGPTGWRRAQPRERFDPGARIRTGEGAEAVIELSDRNLVSIGEGTTVVVERSEARGAGGGFLGGRVVRTIRLRLEEGTAYSRLRGLQGGGRYDLVTPVATAGVRGTTFTADVFSPADGGGGSARTDEEAKEEYKEAADDWVDQTGAELRANEERVRARTELDGARSAAERLRREGVDDRERLDPVDRRYNDARRRMDEAERRVRETGRRAAAASGRLRRAIQDLNGRGIRAYDVRILPPFGGWERIDRPAPTPPAASRTVAAAFAVHDGEVVLSGGVLPAPITLRAGEGIEIGGDGSTRRFESGGPEGFLDGPAAPREGDIQRTPGVEPSSPPPEHSW